ncbi:MAG: rRNA maturation RNase YbeY [Nitrospinae bacterium CG11_big_fil_rev_8_21_14_0_20_56_8]|nr:MAG: rRNA maturation RNase YbeY [Nitrospinae bacterium CG11_big_fil_rev_8_21_14_0_20_56_8]
MDIQLRNDQKYCPVGARELKKHLRSVLRELECGGSEISILLVDDAGIRELNRRFRKLNKPTDVLSFPQYEGAPPSPSTGPLGDIVVSIETADRQAREHGLSLIEEIVLLLIHGVLHLLGYDHERSKKEELEMKEKTRTLFDMVFPGRLPSHSCPY